MVLSVINRWKDQGLLPDQAKRTRFDGISDIYQDYQERLLILNAVDFGDLFLHCLTLFKTTLKSCRRTSSILNIF